MIVRLFKQFIILFLVYFYFDFSNKDTFFTITYNNHTNHILLKDALIMLFLVYACFELVVLGFKAVVNLIKKDVLISNHDFLKDKESIDILQTSDENKIVLSRNQFDEAAILIVKAMSDITSGLMNNARRNLVSLRKLIGDDAIIDILMLKIYKGEKNFDKMEQLSQKLMQNEDIQLVGMKAALEAQIEKKEFNEALKTVNQAFEVRQDLYWVVGSAFLLRAKNNDWLGALEVLETSTEKGITPPIKASRLKAVALYELSKEAKRENDTTKFFKFITQAIEENPKLVPAALDLADYYIKNDNQKRKAERVLCKIWSLNPTYEIAQKYLNLFEKDTKQERIQRMEKLALSNSIRPSLNNLLLAELYIKAKKQAKAKAECRIFLLKNPATEKIASLLSTFDKKSSKDTKDIIKNCPKDFQWVCANCGTVHNSWEPICKQCNEIGRIYWHLYLDNNMALEEDNY
jgi:HemY protein